MKFVTVEEIETGVKTLCVKASNFDMVLLEKEVVITGKDITNVSITEMIAQEYEEFMRSSVWEKFYNSNFESQSGFRAIFLNGNDGHRKFDKFSEAPVFETPKEAVDWAEENLPDDTVIVEVLNNRGLSIITIDVE
jgi:hypothetical protein